VQAAYSLGRQSHVKLLLNQQQPDQISRLMRYHDYMIEARAEKFDEYIGTIKRLEQVEPEITARVSQLKNARNDLVKQHKKLVLVRDEREKVLKKVRSLIKNKDDELKKMEKDRAELARVIAAVEDLIKDIPLTTDARPFSKLKGKLPWPVKGRAANRYGATRQGHLKWDGILIKAKSGTKVQAIHHGRVIFADWLRGQGLLMIIDHGDGYMSLYGHNEVLLKEPGEWVRSGDTIAHAGNSGGQKHAGVYFEIRHKGKPTNPKRWCKKT